MRLPLVDQSLFRIIFTVPGLHQCLPLALSIRREMRLPIVDQLLFRAIFTALGLNHCLPLALAVRRLSVDNWNLLRLILFTVPEASQLLPVTRTIALSSLVGMILTSLLKPASTTALSSPAGTTLASRFGTALTITLSSPVGTTLVSRLKTPLTTTLSSPAGMTRTYLLEPNTSLFNLSPSTASRPPLLTSTSARYLLGYTTQTSPSRLPRPLLPIYPPFRPAAHPRSSHSTQWSEKPWPTKPPRTSLLSHSPHAAYRKKSPRRSPPLLNFHTANSEPPSRSPPSRLNHSLRRRPKRSRLLGQVPQLRHIKVPMSAMPQTAPPQLPDDPAATAYSRHC